MGHANTTRTGTSKLVNEDVKSMAIKIHTPKFRKLSAHAEKKGMSASGFAKKLIEEYIDKHILPFEEN